MQGLRLILLCSRGIQPRAYFSALPCGSGEESGVPLPTSCHKLKISRTSQGLLRRWEVWLPLLPETGFAEAQGGQNPPLSVYCGQNVSEPLSTGHSLGSQLWVL